MKFETFDENQIEIVYKALEMAEDIVSGYYKMSPAQWLRNRYEVKTFAELNENEKVVGPFAQIVKYSGYRKNRTLGSEVFDLYRICLQDASILSLSEHKPEIDLASLLVYVQVHELIHIVRFGQFEQFFHANVDERAIEETLVHRLTQDILRGKNIKGLDAVFTYYASAVL